MIEFKEVGFGYPTKDLYEDVSFEIEQGDHAVLIGSNGTGKSTLLQLIMHEERYTYDGRILVDEGCRIGYVSQFVDHEPDEISAFDFLAKPFIELLQNSDAAAAKMAEAEDMDAAYAEFQKTLDQIESTDAYNYESNIGKQLSLSGLEHLKDTPVNRISGGEYKLLFIIRNMMLKPQLLILDEPDVFLDFENVVGLLKLINAYDGTLLAITHSRLLLSQCFDKILHIEDMKLQQFPGTYSEYRKWLLETKVELFEATEEYDNYVHAQQKLLERFQKRAEINSDPKLGRQIQARKKLIKRIKDIRGNDPFLDMPVHDFFFPEVEAIDKDAEPQPILTVEEHSIEFERPILSDVNFTINKGDKIAIVGANGTGKSSLIKDIHQMFLDSDYKDEVGYFGQIVEMRDDKLSGGERNLAQIEKICDSEASILLLDEPTSHLDVHAQRALENALQEYNGTVVLISHDFYTVTNCTDRILILENGTLRETSGRAYRKSIYKQYFTSDIFEQERENLDLERKVGKLLIAGKFEEARELLGMGPKIEF